MVFVSIMKVTDNVKGQQEHCWRPEVFM